MVIGPQKTGKLHTNTPMCTYNKKTPIHLIPLAPLVLSEGDKGGGSYLLFSTHVLSTWATTLSLFLCLTLSVSRTQKEEEIIKKYLNAIEIHNVALCVMSGILIAGVRC